MRHRRQASTGVRRTRIVTTERPLGHSRLDQHLVNSKSYDVPRLALACGLVVGVTMSVGLPYRSPTRASAASQAAARAEEATALTPVEELEQRVFELTNQRRTSSGARRLRPDADLSLAARTHSEDMLRRRFFAHVNPDKLGPVDRLRRISGVTRPVGENIWMWTASKLPGWNAAAARAMADWMVSRPHRENILRRRYTRLGVGAAITASDVRLTQVFE